ncbi:olfactory receptor 2T27-like [Tachyglossus aculeatus]|uniref:olfactory receptor 2T27-like n=1 Tax=Tachyglossus aculeatus TaxID=9261 RepID=UPI0018F52933|nr:olfactory receptor 2T27-like [Tachyglossus aculeatus]
MGRSNATSTVTDFILLGLFPEFGYPGLLLSIALLTYIVALVGNSVLILLIWADVRLHTPMYFLLSQLSLMDVTLISTTVPKLAANFSSGTKAISGAGCGAQIFFSLTVGGAECLLLTLMSYDRYVAVCHPLRYQVLMSNRVCLRMILVSWTGGIMNALVLTVSAMQVPLCQPRVLHHFFCEIPVILKLSCKNTAAYELALFVLGIVFMLIPFSLIVASYTLIFLSILRMDSREGRKKALATCSSHLTVVTLYLGPTMFIYMRPNAFHRPEQNQAPAVFPTIFTPALNPLIYSLRNKEVWGAMTKVFLRWSESG